MRTLQISSNKTPIIESYEEIEKHARRICLGSENNADKVEPTEQDAKKLAEMVLRVREKLSNKDCETRKRERNAERLNLFDTTFDIVNDLYLVVQTIKSSQYEGKLFGTFYVGPLEYFCY